MYYFGKRVSVFFLLLLVGCAGAAWEVPELFEKTAPAVFSAFKGDGEKALAGSQTYWVGVGISDSTEYPSGQLCGGYIESSQKTEGIFTRQWVRAFIIAEGKEGPRVAILISDDWAVSLEMREALIDELSKSTQRDKDGTEVSLLKPDKTPFYNDHNVLLNAIHTHTGVMGDAQRHQYNISAGGYNENLMMITVRAAVEAIVMAHRNLEPCTIEFSKGKLTDSYNVSKNRSFTAHLNNESDIYDYGLTPEEFDALPSEEEKEAYRLHEEATDKMMYLLRFRTVDGRDKGALNWFSVHPTSISASYGMISGDNKGFAAQMFESMMGASPDEESGFVAGFAQSALGDVDPCRTIYYRDKFGYSIGEEAENAIYSARAQAAKAMELYMSPRLAVKGSVSYATQWVAMDRVFVDEEFAYMPEVYPPRTWPPATGWSMAKGAEINQVSIPSGFEEGMSLENGKKPKHAMIPLFRCILGPYKNLDTKHGLPKVFCPPEELKAAHFPKPILMASGNANPSWMDLDLPFQIFRIGNIVRVDGVFVIIVQLEVVRRVDVVLVVELQAVVNAALIPVCDGVLDAREGVSGFGEVVPLVCVHDARSRLGRGRAAVAVRSRRTRPAVGRVDEIEQIVVAVKFEIPVRDELSIRLGRSGIVLVVAAVRRRAGGEKSKRKSSGERDGHRRDRTLFRLFRLKIFCHKTPFPFY